MFFMFTPIYVGKIPILTDIFQMGWNHQLENILASCLLWDYFISQCKDQFLMECHKYIAKHVSLNPTWR